MSQFSWVQCTRNTRPNLGPSFKYQTLFFLFLFLFQRNTKLFLLSVWLANLSYMGIVKPRFLCKLTNQTNTINCLISFFFFLRINLISESYHITDKNKKIKKIKNKKSHHHWVELVIINNFIILKIMYIKIITKNIY